jgi:hypothetical protein
MSTVAPDDKFLERIGALLAKAESTDSPHEAEALTAKAQQLATLHAIDLAQARERSGQRHRRQTPIQRKITIGRTREQGLRHRVRLFSVIARVNDVRLDIARNSTYVLAFGFPDDLAVVEKLYASLVTQMTVAGNAAISRGEHREEVYWSAAAGTWRSDARVFRTAFNHAFTVTIADRLQGARAAALAQDANQGDGSGADAGTKAGTGTDPGGTGSGALVLARKADEVGRFYAQTSTARGTWRGARTTTVSWSEAGQRSGEAAGRAARLSAPSELDGARGTLDRRSG